MPKISVIVPVYKAEAYLHRCVNSLLAPTFKDFEVLLVDDGSPDRSGAICDEYASRDSRVRTLHKPNGGVSSARNYGIDNARGEWLSFIDSDDWIDGRCFEKCLMLIEAHHLDLLQFGFARVDEEGKADFVENKKKCPPLASRAFIESDQFLVSVCATLFKADIIYRENIRFEEGLKYAEDQLFLYNYIPNCDLCMKTDEVLYFYLSNPQSATHTTGSNSDEIFKSIVSLQRFPNRQLFASRINETILIHTFCILSNPQPQKNLFTLYSLIKRENFTKPKFCRKKVRLFLWLNKASSLLSIYITHFIIRHGLR